MMGVNSLPKTVTWQRRSYNLNPGLTAPESSTLTTRLPSHSQSTVVTRYTHCSQGMRCWAVLQFISLLQVKPTDQHSKTGNDIVLLPLLRCLVLTHGVLNQIPASAGVMVRMLPLWVPVVVRQPCELLYSVYLYVFFVIWSLILWTLQVRRLRDKLDVKQRAVSQRDEQISSRNVELIFLAGQLVTVSSSQDCGSQDLSLGLKTLWDSVFSVSLLSAWVLVSVMVLDIQVLLLAWLGHKLLS